MKRYVSRNVYCEGYIPESKALIDKIDLDLRCNDNSFDKNKLL